MYPKVLFPYYIKSANNAELPNPELPVIPNRPYRRKNIIPYVGGLFIILFAFTYPVLGLLGLGLLIYGFIIENFNNKSRYHIDLNLYDRDKKLYEDSLEIYRKSINNYNLDNFNHKIKFIDEYRKNLKISTDTEFAKKGRYEEIFFQILKNKFGSKVKSDVKIGFYCPDVYYQDGYIAIDIEIDEPYSLDTNEPIHFVYSDDFRNCFFNAKGIYIIRFAEIQVAKFPEQCVQYIEKLIIQFNNEPLCHNAPAFEYKIPQWNFSEAMIMAKNKFRNTY